MNINDNFDKTNQCSIYTGKSRLKDFTFRSTPEGFRVQDVIVNLFWGKMHMIKQY